MKTPQNEYVPSEVRRSKYDTDLHIEASVPLLIATAKSAIADGLKAIATLWSRSLSLTKAEIMESYEATRSAQDALEYTGEQGKKILIQYLERHGTKIPDLEVERYHALEIEQDGIRMSATPFRKTIDPKKVEALLRAKGFKPENHMDSVITLKFNNAKIQMLIGNGDITKDELENCRHDFAWKVTRPRSTRKAADNE